MDSSVVLGPLAIPLGPLLLFAAVGLGQWVAGAAAGGQPGLERRAFALLLVGLLAARLAFVWSQRLAYAAQPWSVLDIRDGGWSPLAGFAAAAVLAGLMAWRRRPFARPLVLGLGTASVVWLAAWGLGLALARPPGPLPPLALQNLQGQAVALAGFTGKPVVLNLWASWCPPCVREMPVLAEAQATHPGVHILLVNQRETAGQVQAFLQARGMAADQVLLDPRGELAAQLGHRALPTTLFFDAQGRLVDTRVGELSRATLAQRLQGLRQAPAPAR